MTKGENKRGLKIIDGMAMFYELEEFFIELFNTDTKNVNKNILLNYLIFHYRDCFGIGAENRLKLV